MSDEGIKPLAPVDPTVPVDESEGAKALAAAMQPDPLHDYGQPVELPPHAPNFEKPVVAADLPPTVEELPADEISYVEPEVVTADGDVADGRPGVSGGVGGVLGE